MVWSKQLFRKQTICIFHEIHFNVCLIVNALCEAMRHCSLWLIWANKQGNWETHNEFLSAKPCSVSCSSPSSLRSFSNHNICKLPAMLLATWYFLLTVGNMAACKMCSTFILIRGMAEESWLCQGKAVPRRRFLLSPWCLLEMVTALAGAHAGFQGWRPGCRDNLCAESR